MTRFYFLLFFVAISYLTEAQVIDSVAIEVCGYGNRTPLDFNYMQIDSFSLHKKITSRRKNWNYNQSQFIDYSLTSYSYDTLGNMIQEFEERWDTNHWSN